jgi:hypothetical protein
VDQLTARHITFLKGTRYRTRIGVQWCRGFLYQWRPKREGLKSSGRRFTMHNESAIDMITSFWTIRRLNCNENLSIGLGRRRKATVYFTSEERANRFQKADFVERNFKVVQLPAGTFIAWLRQRVERGTHFIYRDPSNLFCLGKPMRIIELLAKMEEPRANDSTRRTANGRRSAPEQSVNGYRAIAKGV